MNNIKGMSEKTRTLFEQFISEVQKESFAEGYEAGKSSIESVEEKTPNQQRAELIEKAKKFIEECKKDSTWGGRVYFVPMANGGQWICDVRFEVNASKRTIVALLFWKPRHYKKGVLKAKGIAKCMPGDVFNEHIGQAIALAKALQIDIPVEFLKAIQPSEVVVGMKVEVKGVYHPYVSTILREGAAINGDENTIDFIERNPDRVIRIVNDTNAQYEVST
ncbi:hypothetical protein [Psychrobacillus sp. FSL K6-1267]|uniref:hypothetical protein n=1 Tax=Psychrobacillus sp. FSL K6-1267 TaxID=2921543 RepID=UPI0030F8C01F